MVVLTVSTSVLVRVASTNKPLLNRLTEKAWSHCGRAFFASVLLCVQLAVAECQLPPAALEALPVRQVARVIDGDTLATTQGERIRLIGINTPELGGQALADRARQRLAALVLHQQLRLQFDVQLQDHYGRRLAHLFLPDGRNVAGLLLRDGLGYPVAIPPNLALLDCQLREAERARQSGFGVWRQPATPVAGLTPDQAGFVHVQGRLLTVTEAGGSWWLQMEGPLVLRIARRDQPYFVRAQLDDWQGRQVEVSGWLVDRSSQAARTGYAPLMLLLTHPAHIRPVPGH